MTRWFCMLLAGSVLLMGFTADGMCGGGDSLDLRARTSIGDITDPDESDAPLADEGGRANGQKSVARAMLLSAVLPGLGQMYAGGRRGYFSGGAMAAADVFSIWRYFVNNSSGDDKKREYEVFAREHYDVAAFKGYVKDVIAVYSGYEPFGVCSDPANEDECWEQIDIVFPLADEGTGSFYEQIGAEDRYVFGWDDWTTEGITNPEDYWLDWNPYSALPDTFMSTTPHRQAYRSLRDEADDFYGTADRYAWIMVIGRVVSMIDAAIMVKLRNRDIAGIGTNPRLTFKAKFGSKPSLKVALKLRF